MNVRVNQKYLLILQTSIIKHPLLVNLFSLLEYFPLFYYVLLSAYYIAYTNLPKFFTDNLKTLSYVYMFHDLYKNEYPFYFLIIILFVYILFLLYKYVVLAYFQFNNKIINAILINFYEIFMFRLLTIFLFDIEIKTFICITSTAKSIIGLIILILNLGVIYLHFEATWFYYNRNPINVYSFDNTLLLAKDKYLLWMKVFMCLGINSVNQYYISLFISLTICMLNIVLYSYQIYRVMFNKLVYIKKKISNFLVFFVNGINVVMIITIIVIQIDSFHYFMFDFINSIFISGLIMYFVYIASEKKMLCEDNNLGRLLYLLNEEDSSKADLIAFHIVNSHKAHCKSKHCKFCYKIQTNKTSKKVEKYHEKISIALYKYLIRDQKEKCRRQYKDLKEFDKYYYLFQLNLCYIAHKENLIRIMLTFNKIKNIMKLNHENRGKLHFLNNVYSFNFDLNLEIIFREILHNLVTTELIQSSSYFIKIDYILESISAFLVKLKSFLEINLKSPKEIIKLANQFQVLKENVHFDQISSKENKGNYPCLLCGFIVEEIFNDQLSKTTYFHDMIKTGEDSLTSRFEKDKIMLIKFDIVNSILNIKQCGKKIIEYKNKNIEEIFPPFLKKEGKNRLIQHLSKNKEKHFLFYYYSLKEGIGERIKMKFTGFPSLEVNKNYIFLYCTYLICKGNILFFEKRKKEYSTKSFNILLLASKNMAIHYGLFESQINLLNEAKTYIEKKNIIEPKSKSLNIKDVSKLIKIKEPPKDYINPKSLIVNKKDKIGKYTILFLHDTSHLQTTKNTTKLNNSSIVGAEEDSFDFDNQDLSIEFIGTQTGMSSSVTSKSTSSSTNQKIIEMRNQQICKYKKFEKYSLYIILFNIFIMFFLIIFLVIQLLNNKKIEKTFDIIKIYEDFQNIFYATALSLFSMTCNADSITDQTCVNLFVVFSYEYIESNGFNEEQLLSTYVARQLNLNTELIIKNLKEWEKGKADINSKELDAILNEDFIYHSINQVGRDLNVVELHLTFDEGVKRFANVINTLSSDNSFRTTPVYTITSNGKGDIDLSNISYGKKPMNGGTYLSQALVIYYTIILNYQKYILKLVSIGDLLHVYFDKLLRDTTNEIIIFLLLLIAFHIMMMCVSFVFVIKYKNLHMDFYIKIIRKLDDKIYLESFFKKKIEYITTFLELYKDNPNNMINKITKLKDKEASRILKKIKSNRQSLKETDKSQTPLFQIDDNKNNIDQTKIRSQYLNEIIIYFVYNSILFGLYYIGCVIFIIIIKDSIHNLSLMNEYTKGNYDLSNNIYINLGLCQIMALTNQTDIMLNEYFTSTESSSGYIRANIEETITLLMKMYRYEKTIPMFKDLKSLISLDCTTLYPSLKDALIEAMVSLYPQSDYYSVLEKYCSSLTTLYKYQDDKLLMLYITYQTKNILDMFTERTYDKYADINNSYLLYKMYCQILIVLRPLRRFLYTYILTDVIQTIINKYIQLIVIFLVFNFVYELIILFVLKYVIIKDIIQSSKEILMVAKAFDCFI